MHYYAQYRYIEGGREGDRERERGEAREERGEWGKGRKSSNTMINRSQDAQDLELLLKLKQGQVEVEQAPFVTDYSDSVFINKQVIEDYNTSI